MSCTPIPAWRRPSSATFRERIERSGMHEQVRPHPGADRRSHRDLKNGKKSVTERKLLPGLCAGRDADGRRVLAPGQAHQQGHRLRRWRQESSLHPISRNPTSMKIVNQMQEGLEKPRPKVEWMIGEMVRVKEGPFTDFNGAVEEVNYEKSKVKVSVTIFGRATGVELDFAQVEKV
jgi:transcriptional antiterminator NusG